MNTGIRSGALVAALLAAASAFADVSLKTASPKGEVAQVRQVRATFSESMVKLGDPRLPAPMDVACTPALAGNGRWVDDKTWVFDFVKDAPPGTRCNATPKPGTTSVAGVALAADAAFAFSTGGPAIVRSYPDAGSPVEEEQVFALLLNGPAVADSVQRFAWCEVSGVGERVPVTLIAGATRDAILDAVRLKPQAARTVTLRCARPAAPGSKLSLVWGAGIATASGIASRADRRLDFPVRPAFTASFTCERTSARADCLPMRPLRLEFSAPVPRRLAEQVVLDAPDGHHKARVEQHRGEAVERLVDVKQSGLDKFLLLFGRKKGEVGANPSEDGVSAVEWDDVLPEKAALTIRLPAGFADDAGRALENAGDFPLATRTSDAPALAKFPSGASFGILELNAEPVLPLAVRQVEGQLGVKALTLGGAPARELNLTDDAAVIAWFVKVARYHESVLDRGLVEHELGIKLPPVAPAPKPAREAKAYGRDKTKDEQEEDAEEQGNTLDPKMIGTREVSLLNKAAGVHQVALPAESRTEPHPFEVIGIPLPQPGYHVVEIESPRLGQALLDRAAPMYVRTGVLVTNLGVHFKWAPAGSGVWVTTLDKAKPVAEAAVQVSDCRGKPVWKGRTDAQGFARIEQPLPRLAWEYCGGAEEGSGPTGRPVGYFVSARKTDAQGRADMAFVWSTWQEGIEPWRFNLNSFGNPEEVSRELFHTVMDRTLLRAGQTVSMKSHARRELLTGLGLVDAKALPDTLRIASADGEHVDLPLTWRAGRYAETTYAIPADAKLGVYEVSLRRGAQQAWTTGSFRVEEFRVPAMIGRLVPPKGPQVDQREIALDVMVNYTNGGGAANLPLRVSAQEREVDLNQALPTQRYPGFHFDAPRAPGAGGGGSPFEEAYVDEDDAATMTSQADPNTKLVADKLPVTLDKSGAGKVTLAKLPPVTAPRELLVQASYADPNGEVQTLSQTLPLWPSAVVLGVRTDEWISVHGKLPVQVVALDTAGKPASGVAVSVRAIAHHQLSARKRLVGGFYAYDNKDVDEDLGEVCSGRSDARGLVLCDATLASTGQVELVAQAKDAQGHVARAASSVWVTRQGEVWFGAANDDRMDVLPEQRTYQEGDVARFQVRSPFRHATALVAIERNGIIETHEVELNGRDPTVDVRVRAEWAPNVFVSVLAVRGRVREVPWYSFFSWGWKSPVEWWHAWREEGPEWQAPTAMVDLAKPAFKYGITEIEVGDRVHRLKVEVTPDKPSYPIRATSQVRVKVTLPDGRPAPAGSEVSLAAVDEALLALRPNASWDLFDAMIKRRDYAVETSTAQMQIIGKRHFGKKAAPPGGGGGQFPTRELFDTLLLWNPSVVLDAKGEAVVPVPLNDALTSFRIVAVADVVQGADAALFGTGEATIAATQDLQIVSGVPPLVREGDHYRAMFTLRNTTKQALQASISGQVGEQALPAQAVAVPADGAADAGWDVDVPLDAKTLAWVVAADAGGAHDRMKFAQRVAPAVPVAVQEATLVQLDKSLRLPVAAPANALADAGGRLRGGIELGLRPRLGDGLPGVRAFFDQYPFVCLEQQASVAIGLRDTARWKSVVAQLPLYLDEDGLASYFPVSPGNAHGGSDSLSAYLLAISDEATKAGDAFALPDELRAQMERGLIGFVEGRVTRDTWRPAFLKNGDLDVRKLAAMEALSRRGKVQPRMLDAIQVLPNQWPTGAVIDWLQVLDRVPAIPDREKKIAEAEQVLRARLNVQGTRLGFSTERDDSWWWLMSNADVNSVRLVLAVLARPGWQDDVPRIVTGTLQRQQAGHWSTTVANAWGAVAMAAFSKRFETVPVRGATRAGFDVAGTAFDWSRNPNGGALPLGWPAGFGAKGGKADGLLAIDHDGSGKPWVTITARAAVPVTAPFGSGYRITKTVTAVEQKVAGKWSRGDVARVRLDLDVQADATWVVIDDPIPGGAALLGTGLGQGGGEQIATGSEKTDERGWLAYQERRLEAFRAYYRYLPKGAFSVEYTMRLNNPGRFNVPPTRVEAMYAPEMFGEAPNAAWTVEP